MKQKYVPKVLLYMAQLYDFILSYTILWMLCFHNEHAIFAMIIWLLFGRTPAFPRTIGYEYVLNVIASFNIAFKTGP